MNDSGIGVKPSPAPREPLYRLAGITTQRGTDAPVQDLDYAYALSGVPNSANIVEINDHVLGEDLFYHYDIHNRLTSVTSGSYTAPNPIASYTYGTGADAGKMTSKDEGGLVSFQFDDPDHVHAVSSTSTGEALTYDKAGSIAARVGGESYTFDAENRMTQVASYPTTTAYAYDGQGNLAVRGTTASPRTSAIDDRTVYVGGIYEERSEYGIGINARATVQYQALGRTIATRTGADTTYLLSDHLGSTAGTISSDGAEVRQVRYWPYGATRTGGAPTDKLYTAQQMEAGGTLGTYFYHARFYSTALGHFLSADPLIDRGFNRYAYVSYMPMAANDPSGMFLMIVCGFGATCALGNNETFEAHVKAYWAMEFGYSDAQQDWAWDLMHAAWGVMSEADRVNAFDVAFDDPSEYVRQTNETIAVQGLHDHVERLQNATGKPMTVGYGHSYGGLVLHDFVAASMVGALGDDILYGLKGMIINAAPDHDWAGVNVPTQYGGVHVFQWNGHDMEGFGFNIPVVARGGADQASSAGWFARFLGIDVSLRVPGGVNLPAQPSQHAGGAATAYFDFERLYYEIATR